MGGEGRGCGRVSRGSKGVGHVLHGRGFLRVRGGGSLVGCLLARLLDGGGLLQGGRAGAELGGLGGESPLVECGGEGTELGRIGTLAHGGIKDELAFCGEDAFFCEGYFIPDKAERCSPKTNS